MVAYRDTHREEVITRMGGEVINAWFKGIKEGAATVDASLEQWFDTDCEYRSDEVLRTHTGKGLAYLRKRINRNHERMALQDAKVLASAACPVDDTYFALVEYTYVSKLLPDERPCVAYKVMEMDVLYDDTVLRVMGIHERGQLTPEDVSCIASVDSAHSVCGATPFPHEDLGPYPEHLSNELVLANTAKWCQARSSGQPEELLDGILDPSFRLWDAYGLLPVLCDPARRAEPDACVVRHKDVKDIIRQTKTRYQIKCKVYDSAVSQTQNVGFTHWRSNITPVGDGTPFTIEGIEVDIFGPDGKLKDIWLFRDPMDFERRTLEGPAPKK